MLLEIGIFLIPPKAAIGSFIRKEKIIFYFNIYNTPSISVFPTGNGPKKCHVSKNNINNIVINK